MFFTKLFGKVNSQLGVWLFEFVRRLFCSWTLSVCNFFTAVVFFFLLLLLFFFIPCCCLEVVVGILLRQMELVGSGTGKTPWLKPTQATSSPPQGLWAWEASDGGLWCLPGKLKRKLTPPGAGCKPVLDMEGRPAELFGSKLSWRTTVGTFPGNTIKEEEKWKNRTKYLQDCWFRQETNLLPQSFQTWCISRWGGAKAILMFAYAFFISVAEQRRADHQSRENDWGRAPGWSLVAADLP